MSNNIYCLFLFVYDVELFCELLLSRISVMKLSKQCPAELQESVCSLCYAAGRHQHLTELLTVRQILAAAYGKEFVQKAVVNHGGCVNATVLKKLAIQTPCTFSYY
jgi:vacuolar protein sorting-associated protein IST1